MLWLRRAGLLRPTGRWVCSPEAALPRHQRYAGAGIAGAFAGAACAVFGGCGWVQPASAASPPDGKPTSWLPAKPGGGARTMPAPDPGGRPRVIFQGELGAYGETAINEHFGADRAVPVPCDDFESVGTCHA